MRKKITITDIARELGYSVATVSRALNKKSNVKSETRKKVESVAKKLKYTPNIIAKSLVEGESRVIGFLFPDARHIYHQVPTIFAQELEKKNYRMMSYYSGNNVERQEKYIELINMQQADGLLICPVPGTADKTLKQLENYNTPYAFFNRYVNDQFQDKVIFDFLQAHLEIVEYYHKIGKNRIHMVIHNGTRYKGDRYSSLLEVIKERGYDMSVSDSEVIVDGMRQGYGEMRRLHGLQKKVDVLLCPSDAFALGAIRCCYDIGVEIGKDISIIGCYSFDDYGVYTYPKLSTIQCDFTGMARDAVYILMNLLENEEGQNKLGLKKSKTFFIKRQT